MRKKYLLIAAVIFSAAATIFSCSKKNNDNELVMSYNQTKCADAWGSPANDSLTLVNVNNYLDGLGLYKIAVAIIPVNVADTCAACSCKTGKVIYVTTSNSSTIKAQYQAIGFIE